MVEKAKDPIKEYQESKANRDKELAELDNGIALVSDIHNDSEYQRLIVSDEFDKMVEQIKREREEAKPRKIPFKKDVESSGGDANVLIRGDRGRSIRGNLGNFDHFPDMHYLSEAWTKNNKKPYSVIYKYPTITSEYTKPLPDGKTLVEFLSDNNRRSIVIAEMNNENKLNGYLVIRKTRKTEKSDDTEDSPRKRLGQFEPSDSILRKTGSYINVSAFGKGSFQEFCKKYDLKYRFIEAKPEPQSQGSLEGKVESVAAVILFLSSIILSSGLISGSSVNILSRPTAGILSVIFFIIGIFLSFILIKKKIKFNKKDGRKNKNR